MKQRALVTGGSRGIGAAVAEELAAAGHPVVVNYRSNESAAREVQARIASRGGHAEVARFDVADPQAVREGLEALAIEQHPIGIVVNNAGIAEDAPFPALSHESWTRVTRTTLDGFYNVTHPLVMPMVKRRWGRIINIASVSAIMGNRGQANYAAAKAGLIGATRSLARELAKRNITVNAVAPGLIETEMLKNVRLDEALKMVPMRRLGQPTEVAKLVGFLAGDHAAYITGQVIGINGGMI